MIVENEVKILNLKIIFLGSLNYFWLTVVQMCVIDLILLVA